MSKKFLKREVAEKVLNAKDPENKKRRPVSEIRDKMYGKEKKKD